MPPQPSSARSAAATSYGRAASPIRAANWPPAASARSRNGPSGRGVNRCHMRPTGPAPNRPRWRRTRAAAPSCRSRPPPGPAPSGRAPRLRPSPKPRRAPQAARPAPAGHRRPRRRLGIPVSAYPPHRRALGRPVLRPCPARRRTGQPATLRGGTTPAISCKPAGHRNTCPGMVCAGAAGLGDRHDRASGGVGPMHGAVVRRQVSRAVRVIDQRSKWLLPLRRPIIPSAQSRKVNEFQTATTAAPRRTPSLCSSPAVP